MELFCAAIRKDSVSLLRFPFLSHVHDFSGEMVLISCLKRPLSCFSSHFCFLVIVILLVLVLSVLFLIDVISLSLYFSMYSSSHCIDASTLYFNAIYSLSTSSLGCSALCMFISFLVLWFICLGSFLFCFKNGPEYLTRGTAQVFIPLIRFLLYSFVSSTFWFSRDTLNFFLSSPLI